MRILQFSDPHLRGDGQLSFQKVDTAHWLSIAAAHLAALRPKPDVLVLTGDLADSGDERAYVLLRAALEPLNIPIWACPATMTGVTACAPFWGPGVALCRSWPRAFATRLPLGLCA